MERPIALAKTQLGMESVASSYIEEVIPGCKAVPAPKGFKGLVLVYGNLSPEEAVEKLKNIPEIEKVLPVYAFVRADLDEIVKAGSMVAKGYIHPTESFAVRCIRRGRHEFTSLEVNSVLGAKVVEEVGSRVDLSRPDRVLVVEVLGEDVAIGVVHGSEFPTKKGKKEVYPLLSNVWLAQLPYLGGEEARFMGEKVGRAVQSFEISTYVLALKGPTPLIQLLPFAEGVKRGIESRYRMQKKVYDRPVKRVNVEISSIYELVRGWNGPIIVFEPEGRPYPEVSKRIAELVKGGRLLLLMGSREGVPSGLFRFADLVVDLAPGISLATEVAVSSALSAITFSVSGD